RDRAVEVADLGAGGSPDRPRTGARPDHDQGAAALHRAANTRLRADPAGQARRSRTLECMNVPTPDDGGRSDGLRSRRPRRLVLAFLGEFVAQDWDAPVRTGVFLEVLRGAGVAAPAARAALDRLVANGVLSR